MDDKKTLEVIAPFVVGSPDNNANELSKMLVALAERHGGLVSDPDDVTCFHRFVEMVYDGSLEEEVDGLRKKFPDTRFLWSKAILREENNHV